MKIGIASDHRGYVLKKEIIKELKNEYEIIDFGTDSEERVDYPDYAFKLGKAIQNKDIDLGIAICGTGIGISIALNKVKGVLCAKISNKEEAKLAKEHNHANAIAFSGLTKIEEAKEMILTFLNSKPNNEQAHLDRINKILKYEEENEL